MTEQTDIDLGEVDPADLRGRDEFDVEIERDKWASTLAELVDIFFADGKRRGMDDNAALELAQHVAMLLAQHFGGRPVYLPRGEALKQALRDRMIYRLHTGDNAEALADRFDTTVRTIQRIVVAQQQIYVRKRQGRLFGDG
jgi:Mor family transcriptional regulator